MTNRQSSLPPPPPTSNTVLHAVLVLLLAGGIGGIVYFKFIKKDVPALAATTNVPPKPSSTSTVDERVLDDIPAPLPVKEKPSGTPGPAGPAGSVVYVPASGGCDAKCTGASTPELQGQIRSRASVARNCYNRALNTDDKLEGKVTIALKIGANGSVCGGSVASASPGMSSVGQCALSALRGVSYAAPNGGCLDVTVPIAFQAGK